MINPKQHVTGIRRQATGKSVLGKFTKDPRPSNGQRDNQGNLAPSRSSIESIANRTKLSINDAENIMASLPDTELAMQILVSSILSPNDLRNSELTWSCSDFSLDAEKTGLMLEVIKGYFEDDYKIKTSLTKILENALFMTGSYPMAVIPESAIDEVIHGQRRASFESINNMFYGQGASKAFTRNLGIAFNASMESSVGHYIQVTDNPDSVKRFFVKQQQLRQSVNSSINKYRKGSGKAKAALESINIRDRKRNVGTHGSNAMVSLKSDSIRTISTEGHPLVLRLPSEAVVPLPTPGTPEEHLGYFVLIDINGNPVSSTSDSSHYNNLSQSLQSGNASSISNTLSEVGLQMNGDLKQHASGNDIVKAFSSFVDNKINELFEKGDYEDVEFTAPEEIYRVMLARSLAKRYTQLLFIPTELMTYVAFDYNRQGIGRSLLEKSKILAGIRASLMYGNTMASLRNSTPQRNVNISVDPDDPEPEKTIERLVTAYMQKQSTGLPIGYTGPVEIADSIRSANTSINVSGSDVYPETNLEVSDSNSSRTLVDTELDETMRRRHISSYGLSPEMVDATQEADFAVSVINSNLLFTKRIGLYQEKLEHFIVDFIQKFTTNSGNLLTELLSIAHTGNKISNEAVQVEEKQDAIYSATYRDQDGKDNSFEYNEDDIALVEGFLAALTIKLPAPDSTKMENQLQLYSNYADMLEQILPAYITEDSLDIIFEQAEQRLDPRAALDIIKGYFLRRFIRENNIMPELHDLLSSGEDTSHIDTLLEQNSEQINTLGELLKRAVAKMQIVPVEPEPEPAPEPEAPSEPAPADSEPAPVEPEPNEGEQELADNSEPPAEAEDTPAEDEAEPSEAEPEAPTPPEEDDDDDFFTKW